MAKSITGRVIDNARKRGVVVYTRRQWGSVFLAGYQWRRRYRKHKLLPNNPVDTVWQHITVTRDTGRSSRSFKADVRTVERIGIARFGTGGSYNWLVDAETGQVALLQSLDAAGAHTLNDKNIRGYSFNQNYVSLAISVIGMPGAVLSDKAKNAIVQLLKAHIEEGAVTEGFDYNPHSMVAYKSCPTENIHREMDSIRKAVAKPDTPDPRLVINVGTFNLGPGDLPVAEEKADLARIANADLDIFGLQEVERGKRRAFTKEFPTHTMPSTCGFNNERWKLLDKGNIELSPRTYVGVLPGKRRWMPARFMDWQKVQHHETGTVVWHANVHLVSSSMRSLRRRRLHDKQMKVVVAWLKAHKDDHTVLTGDFNLDHRNWKTSRRWKGFRENGFVPNWRIAFVRPTLGKRFVDAIWSNAHPRWQRVDRLNSDHNGVRVRLGIRI